MFYDHLGRAEHWFHSGCLVSKSLHVRYVVYVIMLRIVDKKISLLALASENVPNVTAGLCMAFTLVCSSTVDHDCIIDSECRNDEVAIIDLYTDAMRVVARLA